MDEYLLELYGLMRDYARALAVSESGIPCIARQFDTLLEGVSDRYNAYRHRWPEHVELADVYMAHTQAEWARARQSRISSEPSL